MPYTPELQDSACTTLRRLSWAIGEPMTITIQEVFKFLPLLLDSSKVCRECEDTTKCGTCLFHIKNKAEYKSELFTELVQTNIINETFYSEKFVKRTKPKKEKKTGLCKKCRKKTKTHKKREVPEKKKTITQKKGGIPKPPTLVWQF